MTASHTGVFRLFLLAGAIVLASGCSALGGGRDRQPEVVEPEEETVVLAHFEDFDPSAYPDQRPRTQVEVQHDVPEELLDGRVDVSTGGTNRTRRTSQGFRVQLHSTQDKSEAERTVENATAWWRSQQSGAAPVYLVFRQPYYRIRIGNFASRAEAQRFLRQVKQRYPNAFIVPDTIIPSK